MSGNVAEVTLEFVNRSPYCIIERSYYKNGQLCAMRKWKDNKPVRGSWKCYTNDGQLKWIVGSPGHDEEWMGGRLKGVSYY